MGYARWFACSVCERVGLQIGVHGHRVIPSIATNAYRRAFLRWRGFAASSDEIQDFPARPEHVALYLQHVLDTTKSRSLVDSEIYGIQWAHNLADVPSPTNSPIVHAISRASKRIIGTRVTNKKEPISSDMIRESLSTFPI